MKYRRKYGKKTRSDLQIAASKHNGNLRRLKASCSFLLEILPNSQNVIHELEVNAEAIIKREYVIYKQIILDRRRFSYDKD